MFRNLYGKAVVVMAAMVMFVCMNPVRAAAFEGSVQGVVKDSSGAPVTGAFVKLINEEKHLTYLVISKDQGRYTINDLPLGKYTVQGVGKGYQSELVPADVAAGKAATADVSLTAEQAPMLSPGMPLARGGADAKGTPEMTTLPEGAGKSIVAVKCIQCHGIQNVLRARGDRARWEVNMRRMRQYAQTGTMLSDLTDQEASVVLDYLTANFVGGPKAKVDPNSRLPRTLQPPEASNYKIVEYDVPGQPRGFHEITLDPRGNAWVSELSGNGHLGKLDPVTLTFSEVAVPGNYYEKGKDVVLNGMTQGQGDQLWAMDSMSRRLFRYDSKTGEFNVYSVPKLKWGSPMTNSMRIHPDGSLWFTAIQSNVVGNFNPKSEKFAFFDVPIGVKTGKRAAPYGMAISGDGKVWFPINEFDLIGRLDPATGKIDEMPIPLKVEGRIDARKMGLDGNGDVWVGLHGVGKLMKIDHKTTKMTIYTPPTPNSGVYGVCGDLKTNMVWFAEDSVDKVGRFDPKTETFTEFPLPRAENDMRICKVDMNNSNRVWFSGVTSNRVFYIEMLDGKKM